jgi:hypothetical protein
MLRPLLLIAVASATLSALKPTTNPKETWQQYLSHLPVKNLPILNYKGQPVANQDKHIGIIPFDVGTTDLQQCADALMRLRAEYLFSQQRYSEVGFHFVSGQYYSWDMYCRGLKPIPKGNGITFRMTTTSGRTHESLRTYLDLVYAYASTISLAKELKPASDFEVGTVVIHPGSPGHCFIIIDSAIDDEGHKVYKLAEGYTPAQSIYVLRNTRKTGMDPWYTLSKNEIETASYDFKDFLLRKFE